MRRSYAGLVRVHWERLRARIEASCAAAGVPYPWWVPVTSTAAIVFLTAGALVQRDALVPPTPVALAGLLAISPMLLWTVTGRLPPPLLESAAVLAAVALLLLDPAHGDFAPLLLAVFVAEMAATYSLAVALGVTALGVAVVLAAALWGSLAGAPLYVTGVLLGLTTGRALRWQVRALDAERAGQNAVRERAVSDERQRIARDVHDVLGHSLSTVLLHITGARHALQHDGDVQEALDALADAERVGRTAMLDVRRSVGVLGTGPAPTQPPPGAADIAELVERTRAAGIAVDYEQVGELSEVDTALGVALYRIAQESLANIAKHAPRSPASVRLETGAGTRLTVRNRLPAAARPNAGGAGLTGMASRAVQFGATLRAGRDGGDWVVDLALPDARSACPLRRALP